MSPPLLLTSFAALTLGGSLLGGWVPGRVRMTHARLQLLMSGVAGLMLGVGLLHMLPHAADALPTIETAVAWLMAGLLVTFFLQRFLHFHHHEAPETEAAVAGGDVESAQHHRHHHGHAESGWLGSERSDAPSEHGHVHSKAHALRWIGIASGLVLHTLLDGMALAASVETEAAVHPGTWLPGLETFLAVVLHKPLDSMAIATLMLAGGSSLAQRRLVNAGFAIVCPLGAALFYFGAPRVFGEGSTVAGAALAFSAGMFVCISLADLLPELQFHRHDRVKLSAALLAGVLLAWAISQFGHAQHAHDASQSGHEHDREGHLDHHAD